MVETVVKRPVAWIRRFDDGTYDVWHGGAKPRESDHGDSLRWKIVPLYERPAGEPSGDRCGDPCSITCALPSGHEGDHSSRNGMLMWKHSVNPEVIGMTSEQQSRQHYHNELYEALSGEPRKEARCCLCGGDWRAPNNCMNAFHRWAGAEERTTE